MSNLEYTQQGLRTYLVILAWDLLFHSPRSPGEETGIDSLNVTEAGAVQPVRSTRGFTVSVSDSFSLFRLNSCLYVSQMIYDGHYSMSEPKLIIYIKFYRLLLARHDGCFDLSGPRSRRNGQHFPDDFTMFRPKCA